MPVSPTASAHPRDRAEVGFDVAVQRPGLAIQPLPVPAHRGGAPPVEVHLRARLQHSPDHRCQRRRLGSGGTCEQPQPLRVVGGSGESTCG